MGQEHWLSQSRSTASVCQAQAMQQQPCEASVEQEHWLAQSHSTASVCQAQAIQQQQRQASRRAGMEQEQGPSAHWGQALEPVCDASI